MNQDQKLIREILESTSPQAYKTLVEKYQGRVFTICMKILRNREEAEEVAQDVFVKGFRELKKLRDPGKFPNWLMKIAYSKCIDRSRLKTVLKTDIENVREVIIAEEDNPFLQASASNQKEILAALIQRLEPEEAAVITMYYMQDRPVKEIAETTGLSLSNVKIKLFRARKSLRQMIGQHFKNELKDLI